jgi:hypothetical protein
MKFHHKNRITYRRVEGKCNIQNEKKKKLYEKTVTSYDILFFVPEINVQQLHTLRMLVQSKVMGEVYTQTVYMALLGTLFSIKPPADCPKTFPLQTKFYAYLLLFEDFFHLTEKSHFTSNRLIL